MILCQRPECQSTSGCAHTGYLNGVFTYCVIPAADLSAPFKPCAIYYPDADFTEIVLEDVPTIWGGVEWAQVGRNMMTGEIVAVRLAGRGTTRNAAAGSNDPAPDAQASAHPSTVEPAGA